MPKKSVVINLDINNGKLQLGPSEVTYNNLTLRADKDGFQGVGFDDGTTVININPKNPEDLKKWADSLKASKNQTLLFDKPLSDAAQIEKDARSKP